jgi:hypothetical protein
MDIVPYSNNLELHLNPAPQLQLRLPMLLSIQTMATEQELHLLYKVLTKVHLPSRLLAHTWVALRPQTSALKHIQHRSMVSHKRKCPWLLPDNPWRNSHTCTKLINSINSINQLLNNRQT